jgi:hypothetical protein
MLIAVGNPRTGADAFGALALAHLVGALGLAHLVWRTWFGSLPRGDLGLAALRDGTQGHGILGDGNQSLAFLVDILAGTPCRHRTSIWHTAGWRTWAWRTQKWRSWMRRSSQGEWPWQFGTGPHEVAALVFGALA